MIDSTLKCIKNSCCFPNRVTINRENYPFDKFRKL